MGAGPTCSRGPQQNPRGSRQQNSTHRLGRVAQWRKLQNRITGARDASNVEMRGERRWCNGMGRLFTACKERWPSKAGHLGRHENKRIPSRPEATKLRKRPDRFTHPIALNDSPAGWFGQKMRQDIWSRTAATNGQSILLPSSGISCQLALPVRMLYVIDT